MALHMPQLETVVKRNLHRVTIDASFSLHFQRNSQMIYPPANRGGPSNKFPSHPSFREGNEGRYTRELPSIAIREITVSRIGENTVANSASQSREIPHSGKRTSQDVADLYCERILPRKLRLAGGQISSKDNFRAGYSGAL